MFDLKDDCTCSLHMFIPSSPKRISKFTINFYLFPGNIKKFLLFIITIIIIITSVMTSLLLLLLLFLITIIGVCFFYIVTYYNII